jgi:hypothetical protein
MNLETILWNVLALTMLVVVIVMLFSLFDLSVISYEDGSFIINGCIPLTDCWLGG